MTSCFNRSSFSRTATRFLSSAIRWSFSPAFHTTNPIKNYNRGIRKITKTKSSFPTDDSLFKILYLIVMDTSEKWTMPIPNWGIILGQLTVYSGNG